MQSDRGKPRIRDILEAVERIGELVRGLTFETFGGNRLLVEAVLFNLVVIGEAANLAPTGIRENYPDLPWEDMRSNRNFIVHEYFRVNPSIIWDTITQDPPPLLPLLRSVLEGEDDA